eukprot:gene5199-8805_t
MSCGDVIGVIREDGTCHCSPFTVKFKYKDEEEIQIFINDIDTKLRMKIDTDTSMGYFEDEYLKIDQMKKEENEEGSSGWKTNFMNTISDSINYERTVPNEKKMNDFLIKYQIKGGEHNIIKYQSKKESIICEFYIWNDNDKLIIVDFDGTITKNDIGGHIFGRLGYDYSHEGSCELFSNIFKNGYKILYLTARPISNNSHTKEYLSKMKQNEISIPKGPLIMAPNSASIALIREVIIKSPESYKIEILKHIQYLFTKETPFYSGFGNRQTDVLSYKSVV